MPKKPARAKKDLGPQRLPQKLGAAALRRRAAAPLTPDTLPLRAGVAEPFVLPTIPDQTNYAGRNYMDLVIAPEKFVPQISVDRNGRVNTFPKLTCGTYSPASPITRLTASKNCFHGISLNYALLLDEMTPLKKSEVRRVASRKQARKL